MDQTFYGSPDLGVGSWLKPSGGLRSHILDSARVSRKEKFREIWHYKNFFCFSQTFSRKKDFLKGNENYEDLFEIFFCIFFSRKKNVIFSEKNNSQNLCIFVFPWTKFCIFSAKGMRKNEKYSAKKWNFRETLVSSP